MNQQKPWPNHITTAIQAQQNDDNQRGYIKVTVNSDDIPGIAGQRWQPNNRKKWNNKANCGCRFLHGQGPTDAPHDLESSIYTTESEEKDSTQVRKVTIKRKPHPQTKPDEEDTRHRQPSKQKPKCNTSWGAPEPHMPKDQTTGHQTHQHVKWKDTTRFTKLIWREEHPQQTADIVKQTQDEITTRIELLPH